MPSCVLKTCKNQSTAKKKQSGVTYHRFPRPGHEKREAWIRFVQKNRNEGSWLPSDHTLICSSHFKYEDKYFTKTGRLYLKKCAVPYAGSDSSGTSELVEPISEPEDSQSDAQSDNEVIVFCPKCDTEVSHTAKGIQEDQTKILIAKVYHYFEQEYEELKTIYGDLDLTPLSKFRQRTALATGVSETTILQILKEEEERNADKRQEPPEKPRKARKRSRQTDSSSSEGDSLDDNAGDDVEQSSDVHETQTLVVKIEPPEYYNEEPEIYVPVAVKVEPSDIELNKELAQTDPIYVDVKTAEPRRDVVDNTNETIALNEPAGTKRRARKIPRSDVTATRQHSRGEPSTAATASSVQRTGQLDEMPKHNSEERLFKKRMAERRRKARIKSNPEQAEMLRKRERERYHKKKREGVSQQLSKRERRALQRRNKIYQREYYRRRKATKMLGSQAESNASPQHVLCDSNSQQDILRSSLIGDTELKTEEIEIHEAGPS